MSPVREAIWGEVRVEMLPTEERGIFSEDIINAWREECGSIPGALSMNFRGFSGGGPPVSPIEIWLQGEDMNILLAAAGKLKEKLRSYDGLYQVEDDFRPGKSEARIDLKPEARTLGLTLDDLARQIFAGFFGEEAVRIQRGRDDVRVKVRYTGQERKTLADLDQVRIRTAKGMEVPFYSVANVVYDVGYSSITRVDGLRRVAVSAEVDTNRANAEEVLADLRATYMDGLQQEIPGFVYAFEGAKKNSRDALGSLRTSFPLALALIFVIIASTFRSYIQPFVIMFTVPFGILGAVYGHMFFGLTVTLMSMFGIVALSGVVVNDAIVLIDCVNNFLRTGMPFTESLIRAGVRRFRAVFLTSATTVGGLASIIFARDFQAQFLRPMAVSLAAGLVFSTLLTLLFIPCLLAILNDLRRIAHSLIHGTWPAPEEVEPAMHTLSIESTTPETAALESAKPAHGQ